MIKAGHPKKQAIAAAYREAGEAKDMSPEAWKALLDGLLGFLANDQAHETDQYGRVHLERVPITKATVNPYRGSEIPGWEALGLKPDQIYQLFRDPDEIAKGAATSNGIQLLIKHIPVSAEDHKPYDIAGSIGTNAEFDAPYLYNDVAVWTQYAIDGIEDESRRELSSSYGYKPDMTPGTFEGTKYDGVMRDITFNHVALVLKGRAGPDVAIDEAIIEIPPVTKEPPVPKKIAVVSRTAARLTSALSVLAMDAKFDFAAATRGVTAKNLKTRKPALIKAVLAMDGMEEALAPTAAATGATPDDVILKVLDMVEAQTGAEPPEADEAPVAATEPNAGPPAAAVAEPEKADKAKLMEWLKAKGLGEDDLSEFSGMMGEDEDETEEEKKARETKEAADKKARDEEMKNMVTKEAMDQAIAATAKSVEQRVLTTQREIAQAAAYVRPWVGELAMDESITGASDVYRKALGSLGVAGAATLHADALRPVLDAQLKPGARRVSIDNVVAMDSAAEKSLADRFPHAARISNLG